MAAKAAPPSAPAAPGMAGLLGAEGSASRSSAGAAAPAQQAGGAGATLPPLPMSERMIVKTGSLTLQVADLTPAMQRVNAIIAGVPGAYVAASSTSYRAGAEQPGVPGVPGVMPRDPGPGILPPRPIPAPGQSASLTLKVPSDSFGEVMTRLRETGSPVSEQVSTQEVTEEFVDLEAQVRNLESTEQQYIRLLERAQRIEEILPIQQRITDVRGQIERLRGRMNLLQRRSDVSTITLTLLLPGSGVAGAPDEPRVITTLRYAFSQLGAVMLGFLDVAIYLGVYALPLLPIALFAWWWRGRRSRPATPAPAAGGAV